MDKKLVFTRKPYNGFLYKWSPDTNTIKKSTQQKNGLPVGCSASANSQGEDYQVTYVYDVKTMNGEEHRIAYVECDYVK